MEVAPLLSVEEMRQWYELPAKVAAMAEDLAAPAFDIRQQLCGVYTSVPIGVWLNHDAIKVALEHPVNGASARDYALLKTALHGFVLDDWGAALQPDFIPQANGWVKVAYSPFLRSMGESLNFFPGHYGGTSISNSPSPYASMLTSGLVGAGLGYGAGWLGEKLLPEKFEKGRLRTTLGLLGAGAGVTPGLLWGIANKRMGNNFNDPSLLAQSPGEHPQMDAQDVLPFTERRSMFKEAASRYAEQWAAAVDTTIKQAWGDTMGANQAVMERMPGPMDVDVDNLGHTLWESGASPQLAGMTMGALAAAQQMPGGGDRDSFVTPLQMANLAAHMGAGYVSGALVGNALGLLTGMPEKTQNTLKRTGMYLGIVQSVVPKLFGQ